MPTIRQQLFVLLLVTSNVCFGQIRDISNVFIEPHYRELDLSEAQKEIILHADDSLKKIGFPAFRSFTKLNALTYSVLSGEQKAKYDSIYRTHWFGVYKSNYSYLKLSDEQVNSLVNMQAEMLTSDTVVNVSEYNHTITNTIYNLLDSSQVRLYVEREKLNDQNQRRLRAEKDEEIKKQAVFETKRLAAVKKYHQKFLSKSKARVLDQIRLDHPADALKLEEMENKYQTRTHASEKVELYYCYAEDGALLAPETEMYLKAKYEVRRYQPSLCLYWCSMGGNITKDFIEEEEWMYNQLEYFKSTYSSIIEKELKLLDKGKAKLNKAIDKFRPEKYKGTIVSIVAEERVKALENVAELLLTR